MVFQSSLKVWLTHGCVHLSTAKTFPFTALICCSEVAICCFGEQCYRMDTWGASIRLPYTLSQIGTIVVIRENFALLNQVEVLTNNEDNSIFIAPVQVCLWFDNMSVHDSVNASFYIAINIVIIRNAADTVHGFNTALLIILHPRQEAASVSSLRGSEADCNMY